MARKIGEFPSGKLDRHIGYQSPLERDYIYLLEFNRDNDILSYVEQPGKIFATVSGQAKSYEPDFLVYRTNSTSLVEVKPSNKLEEYHTKVQVAIGRAYCQENDMEFQIMTEKEIRGGSLLNNVKKLFRYSHEKISVYEMHKVFSTLNKLGPITIKELCTKVDLRTDKSKRLALIYHMIWEHLLKVDLDEPINNDTLIIGGGIKGD